MLKNLQMMNSEKKVEDNNVQPHDGKPHVRRSYKMLNYDDWYNSEYNSAPSLEMHSKRSTKVYNTWASRVRKGIVTVR